MKALFTSWNARSPNNTMLHRETNNTSLQIQNSSLSAWKPSSPHEKLDHPTLWCFTEKPTTLPYKIQNSSLWISRMRDPYIDICKWVSQLLGFWLVSFHWYFLVPLGDFMISYSSLSEFGEASVKWAVSRRFSGFPPSKLPLPFVCSHSSHPTEGIFSMHRTPCL